jgi:hypothetical protein
MPAMRSFDPPLSALRERPEAWGALSAGDTAGILKSDRSGGDPEDGRMTPASTELLRCAAEALRRARALPVGAERNELRQIAVGLKWMSKRERRGLPSGGYAGADQKQAHDGASFIAHRFGIEKVSQPG